jgi:DNA mismatch repair protein
MDAPYDKYDVSSIEEYARRLIGKTFKEAIGSESYNNIADFGRKGGLGNLIEKYYFKFEINSRQQPDFEDAGIELKVTPYKMDARGNKTAKERLVITMINYMTVINEAFDDSHLWAKLRLMLIVYYFYEKEISDRLDYRIDYVSLFTPPEEDLKIIKDDYRKIVEKIRSGHAHELSEADTMYLSACTKSSDGSKRTQ